MARTIAAMPFVPAMLSLATMKFEYWRSSIDRLWYWHLKSDSNQKLAQGEAYSSKSACLEAIEQVRRAHEAEVQNLSPRER